MQQHIEVNVEVAKKDVKADKNGQKGAVNKFLTATKLRESFNLNFESMFLDMFTEVPVSRAERPEAPRAVERTAAPVQENSRPAAQAAAARVIEAPRNAEAAPVERSESETANETKTVVNDAQAAKGHECAADKTRKDGTEVDGKNQTENVSAQLKMVRVELKAQLEKTLTSEQKSDLKKKIEDLLEDESLSMSELLAGVMNVVAELIGPIESVDVAAVEVDDLMAGDAKKFLKKLLHEISKALAPEEETKAVASEEAPAPQVEARVENALTKLVAKMDHKITDADREAAKNLTRPEEKIEVKPLEDRSERSVEAPRRTRETVRETARVDAPKIAEDESGKANRPQAGTEVELAAAALRARTRPSASQAVSAAPAAAVGGVTEAARSNRSEGSQQQNWQSSYNQNSSTKFSERAQEARRSEASRPAQNPIFDQIIQNAKITVAGGKSEATIKLNPDFLGKVEMKIVVEDGKVNVKFTAENTVVQNAIVENINDLKKNLIDAGLDVQNVLVMLADQNMDMEGQEQSEQQEQNTPRYRASLEGDEFLDAIDAEINDGSTVRYLA